MSEQKLHEKAVILRTGETYWLCYQRVDPYECHSRKVREERWYVKRSNNGDGKELDYKAVHVSDLKYEELLRMFDKIKRKFDQGLINQGQFLRDVELLRQRFSLENHFNPNGVLICFVPDEKGLVKLVPEQPVDFRDTRYMQPSVGRMDIREILKAL